MKKLDLEKKVLKYSTVAGSVAAFAGTAGAQIVYTDVNPDETYTEDQMYMLDVNNDATFDFVIAQFDTVINYGSFTFPAEGVVLLTAGSNGAISQTGNVPYLAALNGGDPIDITQAFTQASSSTPLVAGANLDTPLGAYPIGPWIDAADHYMGLTFLAGSNFHYGWCRMTVAADGLSFTIKDYAYEATPQTGLNAGQMVGINEDISNGVAIKVIDNSVIINILNTNYTNGKVQVMNTAGQVLNILSLTGNNTVDLNGYASGVYLVSVSFDQGQVNHKLFVR
jgi:hypothetical protein